MKRSVSFTLVGALLLTPITLLNTEQSVSAQSISNYDVAVKQGEKVKSLNSVLNAAIKDGKLQKINDNYDPLTAEVKKLEQSIGKVSGSTNRKKLADTYLSPAKVTIERVIYEISQYRLMLLMIDLRNGIGPTEDEYENWMLELERLKQRGTAVKQAGGYEELPPVINAELRKMEASAQGDILDSRVNEYNGAMNKGNLKAMNEQYDNLTKQLKLAQQRIGQVSGSKNRQQLNDVHVIPAKVIIERTIYEISQYRLLDLISNDLTKGDTERAKQRFATLNRLKDRAIKIKEAGGYDPLPVEIEKFLRDKEQALLAQLESASK